MDVRRLEVLRELKLRGSVTAAARATHRTPSAVSQQLKTLEREVGVPLTERSGRGLALTPAGDALARSASDVAVAIARAEETWRTYLASPEGRVELAVFPTAGRMFLPDLLKAARRVPGLELVATDVDPVRGDFAALVPRLRRRARPRGRPHPVLVGPGPGRRPAGRRAARRRAAGRPPARRAGRGHAARRRRVAVDRRARPTSPTSACYGEIERVAGTPLRIVQRFSDTRVIEALVAAGEGLAVLPRFTSGGRGSGVVLEPLAQLAPTAPDRGPRCAGRPWSARASAWCSTRCGASPRTLGAPEPAAG